MAFGLHGFDVLWGHGLVQLFGDLLSSFGCYNDLHVLAEAVDTGLFIQSLNLTGELVVSGSELVSYLFVISNGRFDLVLLIDVQIAVLINIILRLFEPVFHVRAERVHPLPLAELLADSREASHVLGKVDGVSRHDAWDVVPLVLLIRESVIYETIFNLSFLNLFEKRFLLLPFVHLHSCYK